MSTNTLFQGALGSVSFALSAGFPASSDPPKRRQHSHSEPSGTALSSFCSQGPKLGSSISCLLSINPAWTCPPSNEAMWLESGGLLV